MGDEERPAWVESVRRRWQARVDDMERASDGRSWQGEMAELRRCLDEIGPPEELRYGSEVLCEACARVFCPHGERGHFFHDGCPQCDRPETGASGPAKSRDACAGCARPFDRCSTCDATTVRAIRDQWDGGGTRVCRPGEQAGGTKSHAG